MRPDHTPKISDPLTLPCGAVLKNRVAKSAMSDSLGDGRGCPTAEQISLYETWAKGGLALSVVGEVQGDPIAAEKPGNLVLRQDTADEGFRALAKAGSTNGAQLWLQLGHAGAMAHPPISIAKGPSALDLPGLTCDALSRAEILHLPSQFAQTARLAKDMGFGGVELHAAHGFLLSQFLSPLFNRRTDEFGGSIENRARLTLEVLAAVRDAVGPAFPIGLKLNATDQLEGGLSPEDALAVVQALDRTSIDLIDISGGTYFPGAPSASDAAGRGPYFLDFAQSARALTDKPLMLTGGFKSFDQVEDALSRGVDMIGLARALVLRPDLPNAWLSGDTRAPKFPRFSNPPEGGVTAWYSMRLTELAEGRAVSGPERLTEAVAAYEARDAQRVSSWNARFRP